MRPQFCYAKLRLVVAARPCAACGKCLRVVATQREVPCTLRSLACCAGVCYANSRRVDAR
ncbi:MAG: hypothetical protein Ta2A_14280 [Treponemataceae bacterium]|nr:MAG: hypothetical protein Ta2A_14280 [Treponemataceae bacterium]